MNNNSSINNISETKINKEFKNNLKTHLKNSECVILSIVVISKGIINTENTSQENIILLNISHTDSYLQNLKTKFESLYNQLEALYVFPIQIWKNNLDNTKLSTGNIYRHIYNDMEQLVLVDKLKINIMIDNVKQNVPKNNYIMSNKVIEYFEE